MRGLVGCALLLFLIGCANHVAFIEESHLALKAQFRANSTTPFDVDLGYRRGMTALIPMQDKGEAQPSLRTTPDETPPAPGTNHILRIQHDPDELMSLYTVFKANIGFNEPVEVCHFMASGVAATALLSDQKSLEALVQAIGGCKSGENP